jgi:hypothetical protein
VLAQLQGHGYRIDVESGHADHTTSHDGFVLGVHPRLPRYLPEVRFMGRSEIVQADPATLASYVAEIAGAISDLGRGREHTSHQSA